MMKIGGNGEWVLRNEAKDFQVVKSFGSAEAIWRLFEFETSSRYPAVKKLAIHLEKQQPVYFREELALVDALEMAKTSELTAFFKYNSEHPGTNIPYIQFPK